MFNVGAGACTMNEEDLEAVTVFLEESFEGLGRAETALLELENGAPAGDRLNGLFRELHTIKGTSSFLELKRIEAVAHAAEDVLGKLREGALTLTSDMVTIFLEAADMLRTLLGNVRQGQSEGDVPVADLTTRIRAYLPGARPPHETPPVPSVRTSEARAADPRPPSSSPAAVRSPLHVLVAHGDEQVAKRLAAALEAEGLQCAIALNGADTLGKIRALRPGDPPPVAEVLLLSQQLAVIDGLDLAARYFGGEKPTPKIPFIYLVSSKEEGDAIVSHQMGTHPIEYAVEQDAGALAEQLRAAAARAKAAATSATGDGARVVEEATIRVGVGLLEQLMNLVGELVLARNQILQIASSDKDARANVAATAQRLNIVTSELQEQVMRTRMQPISRLFDQIPRMVRSITRATGKEVLCEIDGNATELDRSFVELVRDPLMHLVRNAIDHGIELPEVRRALGKSPAGALRVRAFHEGGSVNIEIQDDGKGLDARKLRTRAIERGLLTFAEASQMSDREILDVIFLPGFSTAEQVTNISGRGVGMDVVRTQIERAGGVVELSSTLGKGTTIRLKIPLTLAIVPALLVTAAGQRFAIPQLNVLELVHVGSSDLSEQIERVRGAEIYRLRGTVLPLLRLVDTLKIASAGATEEDGVNIVVVAAGDRRYGLLVDGVEDTVEIVVKPMHRTLKRLTCYSGATILGDGSLALILDVLGLAARANMKIGSGRNGAATAGKASSSTSPESFLVFTAGETQCAVPLSTVSRIERIPNGRIERVAGNEVLQYRSAIMPIIRPEDLLPLGSRAEADEQPVVVFDFGTPVGLAVHSIVDIVETDPTAARTRDAVPGVLGSQVLLGKTTVLLDVFGLVKLVSPRLATEATSARSHAARVLVVDDSLLMRSVLLGYLRSAGHEAVCLSDGDGVLATLDAAKQEARPFDVVVSDVEMPGTDGLTLTRSIRAHPDHQATPIVIVSKQELPQLQAIAASCGANAYVLKLDRADLLAKVASVLPERKRSAA
jgi:two-component system chemotaxis sensor kinase CheA